MIRCRGFRPHVRVAACHKQAVKNKELLEVVQELAGFLTLFVVWWYGSGALSMPGCLGSQLAAGLSLIGVFVAVAAALAAVVAEIVAEIVAVVLVASVVAVVALLATAAVVVAAGVGLVAVSLLLSLVTLHFLLGDGTFYSSKGGLSNPPTVPHQNHRRGRKAPCVLPLSALLP